MPSLSVEVVTAAVLIALATGTRLLIDSFFPNVVAFPLVFPALVAATILAGGRCGLIVITGCQTLAWYYLVPVKDSFAFATTADAVGLVLTTAAQLVLLWFLAGYRRNEHATSALLHAQSQELAKTVALLQERAATSDQLLAQESLLRATRRNLEAIYQASGDGLVLCEAIRDADGRMTDYQVLEVNRAHAELTGTTREQMLRSPVQGVYPGMDPIWLETAEGVLDNGIMRDFDIRSRENGRWLNIRVSRVSKTLFQQTFVDISDRYRLEEQRRTLLQEMSHRVMNNFQMIASFLHIQASSAEGAAKIQLTTAEGRVQVLAKLHSLLAYAESASDIDAAAYVKQLCGYLASTLDRPDAVAIICDSGELRLPTETVVPLGFVVSELVTNSAKYAYPAPMAGTIRVSLVPTGTGWMLTIQDEGQGLGDGAPKSSGGLGTRLVQTFVRQMGATLVTTSQGGVRHEISFKPPG